MPPPGGIAINLGPPPVQKHVHGPGCGHNNKETPKTETVSNKGKEAANQLAHICSGSCSHQKIAEKKEAPSESKKNEAVSQQKQNATANTKAENKSDAANQKLAQVTTASTKGEKTPVAQQKNAFVQALQTSPSMMKTNTVGLQIRTAPSLAANANLSATAVSTAKGNAAPGVSSANTTAVSQQSIGSQARVGTPIAVSSGSHAASTSAPAQQAPATVVLQGQNMAAASSSSSASAAFSAHASFAAPLASGVQQLAAFANQSQALGKQGQVGLPQSISVPAVTIGAQAFILGQNQGFISKAMEGLISSLVGGKVYGSDAKRLTDKEKIEEEKKKERMKRKAYLSKVKIPRHENPIKINEDETASFLNEIGKNDRLVSQEDFLLN